MLTSKREAPRVWTTVEDEIFYELMAKLVKAKMWEVIKEDGRLGYRGNQGIVAHVQATVSSCSFSGFFIWSVADESR